MTEEVRKVVIKGDRFKVARIMADAGIPFIFIREAGSQTVGEVGLTHIPALEALLVARPELEGRYARHEAV